MRSPAGLPGPSWLFLALFVVTWALHMLAVLLMLGTITISLIGSFSSNQHWQRLAKVALEIGKVAVSIAIVLGVAPLLFVQVIYDPFWYVSNVLSGRWVIISIFMLLIGYYALYHGYFVSRDNNAQGRGSLVIALVLLVSFGLIMHTLAAQMLQPELWLQWYAPGGHIDTSGSNLHGLNYARFLYFISLTIPVTAAWLSAYTFSLQKNESYGISTLPPKEYLDWLTRLYPPMCIAGGCLAILLYSIWMSTLPDSAHDFPKGIWSWLAILGTILLSITPNARPSYRPMFIAVISIFLIAIAREALRITILGGHHGYDISTYPIHNDSYGLGLFILTLLTVGVPSLIYLCGLAWHSRLGAIACPMSVKLNRMGLFSLYGLGAWIIQYFVVGLLTLARG